MITACFARALQRCTSRIDMPFLLTLQEVIPISKTRNQLYQGTGVESNWQVVPYGLGSLHCLPGAAQKPDKGLSGLI